MENITLDIGPISLSELRSNLDHYKILIFDLDDTVLSEEAFDYFAFKNIAAKFYSLSNSESNKYSIRGIIEKRISRDELFDRISLDGDKKKINSIVEYYQNFSCGPILQKYSIRFILNEMSSKGKKIFIVTNGHPKRQSNKIKDLGIEEFLSGIYICHSLTENRLKPHGDVLDKIGFNCDLKDCLMIGDNELIDGSFAKSRLIDFYMFKLPKINLISQ